MLALVPHPARVAEAGGVDTTAREAGAGPLARLGLRHLRVKRQVEEAIAQQPAVPVQQPGGGAPAAAAAAARRPSPPRPRGRRLRGASAGPAPRLHLPSAPVPRGCAGGRGQGCSLGEIRPEGTAPRRCRRRFSSSPASAPVPLPGQEGQIPAAIAAAQVPPVALGHRLPVS